ncbi:M23 family metallopeptidase [Minwuia sp.]|uniref:M23 family metallopeptidase n=1 Tax=Minwuia sp. TaxID=2493630 RepID=UPI003A8E4A50
MIRSILIAVLVCFSLPAIGYELSGNAIQGGMMIGRDAAGLEVTVDGKPVRVSPDGVFVFGFGRDHAETVTLTVGGDTQVISVARRDYVTQRIDGLPSKMVTPAPETLARIRAENADIAKARAFDTPETWFAQDWIWPSIGPISGVYGSQRILNGKPRRPHFGVDVAGPTGTPVVAPADGIVRFARTGLYFTGGTLILDHGHGVTSTFIHLSELTVEVGQKVIQGEKIAEIGATGRVTGPHLDWRINWFGERLDPQLLVGPMPES